LLHIEIFIANRVAHQACNGFYIKLPHGCRAMRLRGLDTDSQDRADILVAVSLRYQLTTVLSREDSIWLISRFPFTSLSGSFEKL